MVVARRLSVTIADTPDSQIHACMQGRSCEDNTYRLHSLVTAKRHYLHWLDQMSPEERGRPVCTQGEALCGFGMHAWGRTAALVKHTPRCRRGEHRIHSVNQDFRGHQARWRVTDALRHKVQGPKRLRRNLRTKNATHLRTHSIALLPNLPNWTGWV